jgi:hypothetical protein
MSQKLNPAIAIIGIDIGKNSFHLVGHDQCGAIVLRPGHPRTAPCYRLHSGQSEHCAGLLDLAHPRM